MKAITVRQPYAWLIINGRKNIENRDWYSAYKGQIAIHAAQGMGRDEYADALDFVRSFDPALARRIPQPECLVRGCVIGTVLQTGCVKDHPSPWFQGVWGHVYAEARELVVPIPVRGALGIWEWQVPPGGLRYAAAA